MDLDLLESKICIAGRIFGDLLSNHPLNVTLLKLILEYWPKDLSDRSRKTLQRRVRDEYIKRYGKLVYGSLEPVVRAVVISTFWWYKANPDCRDFFVNGGGNR